MKARKDNKSYSILEQQKEVYLKQGYDIYDDEGNRLEISPLKKITYQSHLDAITELEKSMKEKDEKIAKLEGTTLEMPSTVMDTLRQYAEAKCIDLGSASSESGVLNKIIEAEKV